MDDKIGGIDFLNLSEQDCIQIQYKLSSKV